MRYCLTFPIIIIFRKIDRMEYVRIGMAIAMAKTKSKNFIQLYTLLPINTYNYMKYINIGKHTHPCNNFNIQTMPQLSFILSKYRELMQCLAIAYEGTISSLLLRYTIYNLLFVGIIR